jgi:hypothetical protein
MPEDTRCKALTTKGERCKNIRRYDEYCYTHRREATEARNELPAKKRSRFATVTTFISAASSLTVLIEKAAHYWPDIVGWISMIDASGKFAGATPMPFDAFKAHLEKPGDITWPFASFARILEYELRTPSRDRPRALDSIPNTLREELMSACATVSKAGSSLFSARNLARQRLNRSIERLLDLLDQSADAAPALLSTVANDLSELDERYKPEWWSITELRRDYKSTPWRAVMLADNLSGELLDLSSSSSRLASGFSETQSREIIETCNEIFVHTAHLQELNDYHV